MPQAAVQKSVADQLPGRKSRAVDAAIGEADRRLPVDRPQGKQANGFGGHGLLHKIGQHGYAQNDHGHGGLSGAGDGEWPVHGSSSSSLSRSSRPLMARRPATARRPAATSSARPPDAPPAPPSL